MAKSAETTCPICGKTFERVQGMLGHMRIVHSAERETVQRSDLVKRLEGIEDVLKKIEKRLARLEKAP